MLVNDADADEAVLMLMERTSNRLLKIFKEQ
jgi:hypothetical protein